VTQLENAFRTVFRIAHNHKTQQSTNLAGPLYVPSVVAPHITSVFGFHDLPLPPQPKLAPKPYNVTPAVLKKQYSVDGVTPSGDINNRQAVAEFQGEYMNTTDLKTFFSTYVLDAKSGDNTVYKFVGPHQEGAGIEALLDIEYIMGVAPGVKTEFWITPGSKFCTDLVQWTQQLLTSNNVLVHSVSYGWQGNLSTIGCTDSQVDTIDAEFQKLAAKGLTIIFASGDSGSGQVSSCGHVLSNQKYVGTPITSYSDPDLRDTGCCYNCTINKDCYHWTWDRSDNDKRICYLYGNDVTPTSAENHFSGPAPDFTLFPSWPASSPWITAVGSTRFVNNAGSGPEMATDQFGSGGGFSSMFPAPTWQKDAVDSYFNTEPASKLPPDMFYSRTGRATPDISALGEGYQVIARGKVRSVGGTSASAPAFAAMISLINEARLKASKSPLGFLNPFLYQNSAAFTDVTEGSNRISRGGTPLVDGWDAIKGWDPATGYGTPDFQKLLKAAMS